MVSVGLGLMLETFFEPTTARIDDSRVVSKIDVNKYKIHYFNIYTMLRNIISAISSTEIKKMVLTDKAVSKYLLDTLLTELEIVNDIYSTCTCKPVVYVQDYGKVYDNIENAVTVSSMNDNKAHMQNIFDKVVKEFSKLQYTPMESIYVKCKLPSSSEYTLITTHIAFDLLNVKYIRKLSLIESHTGVIKDKSKFNTKYHAIGSKFDKTMFPFTEQLFYILGDNNLIKPMKFKVRAELCNIAMEKKWTSFTSEERVNKVLKDLDIKSKYKIF